MRKIIEAPTTLRSGNLLSVSSGAEIRPKGSTVWYLLKRKLFYIPRSNDRGIPRRRIKRANFLRTFIAIGALFIYINIVAPTDLASFVIFYALLSLTDYLLLNLKLSREVALLTTVGVSLALLLKQLELLNIVTTTLILFLYITLLLYVR